MELALRVDNMETAVPQLYRILSSPSTIGSRPDPARRVVKTHDSERGPRARQAGHQPTEVLPQRDSFGAEGAPLGAHESTRGTSNPSDSDRLPPERPGSSLMPQLHDATEQEAGAQVPGVRRTPTGLLSYSDNPARTPPLLELSDSTPKAYRLGLETTTHQSAASGQRPGARPNAWNNDSDGCVTQETRTLPHGCCSPGTGRRGRYPPGSDTDPTIIAQWVSLR